MRKLKKADMLCCNLMNEPQPTRTSCSISYSFEFITWTLILFALWVADPQWCPSGSVNILIFIHLLRMKNATVVSLNFSVCKQLWPKIFQTQGLSQEDIVQWPCPLIDRVVFYEKLSFLWAVLWASNMPKMHWRPGLGPGPHWGSSRRTPVPDLTHFRPRMAYI